MTWTKAMELFGRATHIDFMAQRRPAVALSALLVAVSLASLAVKGINLAIDFTGGVILELRFGQSVELPALRQHLGIAGFADAGVQHFGTSRDVLIRVQARPGASRGETSEQVIEGISALMGPGFEVRRVEYVGPQIGRELTEQGGLALLTALGAILVYVALRFEWRFAVGSVVALIHDIVITLGCFSLLGLEFDLAVLGALLAVIGYSLNDTIVVFDRIRDNFRRLRKGTPLEVANRSINETLSRTIMTGLTTLLVLVVLLLFGGPALGGFSLALIIGVLVGTYSSIYIASAAALALGVSRRDLLVVKPEGESPAPAHVHGARGPSGGAPNAPAPRVPREG